MCPTNRSELSLVPDWLNRKIHGVLTQIFRDYVSGNKVFKTVSDCSNRCHMRPALCMPLSLYLISCLLQESIHISWLEEGLPGVLLHVVAQTLLCQGVQLVPEIRISTSIQSRLYGLFNFSGNKKS